MRALLSVCLLAVSSAVLSGCHSTESATPAAPQTVPARVVESRQKDAPTFLRVTGSLHAHQSAAISAQVMGRIEQVLVHEGDSVRAGQTLVVLDDAALRAAAEQAEASLKAARNQQTAAQAEAALASSTLQRFKQLQSEKSVSPQEMDEVARRAESAAARLEAMRAQTEAAKAQESNTRILLGYARLLAPFAGSITARMLDPGSMAAAGVPILQVESAGPLQLQVNVDESAIASIHKGMRIAVDLAGASSGVVSEIVPAADPATHSFVVKIDLNASSLLRAGMYGTADIVTGAHPAVLVPQSALVQRGSLNCAYVLDTNGIAQLRSVTTGAVQGDLVEILSGISSGEKLVDLPGDRDLAGKRIEAR